MFYILVALVLLFSTILYQAGFEPIIMIVMVLVLFILVSFTSLTVTINDQYLRIKFGYGIFRKQFLLQEIVSANVVKNKWYYGWGIRYWPNKMIFNVSGFDAVKIVMKNGRVYHIGTDQPQDLEMAINSELNH
jgi:hypothetical protein